jgi:hypothetical protein
MEFNYLQRSILVQPPTNCRGGGIAPRNHPLIVRANEHRYSAAMFTLGEASASSASRVSANGGDDQAFHAIDELMDVLHAVGFVHGLWHPPLVEALDLQSPVEGASGPTKRIGNLPIRLKLSLGVEARRSTSTGRSAGVRRARALRLPDVTAEGVRN